MSASEVLEWKTSSPARAGRAGLATSDVDNHFYSCEDVAVIYSRFAPFRPPGSRRSCIDLTRRAAERT